MIRYNDFRFGLFSGFLLYFWPLFLVSCVVGIIWHHPRCLAKFCLNGDGLKSPLKDFLPAIIISAIGLVKRSGRGVLPMFAKFHGLHQILPKGDGSKSPQNYQFFFAFINWFEMTCVHEYLMFCLRESETKSTKCILINIFRLFFAVF